MDKELKEALDGVGRAFEEHKKVNDERLKALETKGFAPKDLEEKLAKIGADLDKLEDIRKAQAEAEAKRQADRDELEKKLNRLELGGAGAGTKEDKAAREQKASFSAFLRRGEKRMTAEETKALIQGDDTQGGVLAPSEYVREMIKGVVLISPVRQLVRVRQTSQRSVQQPKRTGQSSATWVGEVQDRVESTNPSYGLVEIPTHEMTAEHYVAFAELEDAVFDVEGELRQEFAEQFAKAEGAAVVSGNGVGKPLGFLADAALTGAGKYTPSGQAATIAGAAAGSAGQGDPLVTLFHAVPTAYAQAGKWALNRTSLGAVRKLKDTNGRYLWEPGIANGMPPSILGAPYVECPDMPDEAANAYPIAFGDFARAFTIVDRVSLSVVRDDYTMASKGQVKFVARRRVGGRLVLSEAIRLFRCAAT